MEKKKLISLLAAGAVFLAGCGGSTESPEPAGNAGTSTAPAQTTTSSAAPAATDPAPQKQGSESMSGFEGLYEYEGQDVWMQLFDDGTWILYNELGGQVNGGTWTLDSGSAALLDDGGNYYETLSISGDHLTDSTGIALRAVGEIPVTPSAEPYPMDFYCGLWEYMDESSWLQLFEDFTWIQYNELGGQVNGGTWALDGSSVNLYNDEGSYQTTLEINMTDTLTDTLADITLYQVPEIPTAQDDGDTYAEDMATLPGVWYLDGDLSAESYIYFTEDGSWTLYRRAPGREPWVELEGTLVSAQGEAHAYYAQSSQAQYDVYFQIVPASLSVYDAPTILWDNGAEEYVWRE